MLNRSTDTESACHCGKGKRNGCPLFHLSLAAGLLLTILGFSSPARDIPADPLHPVLLGVDMAGDYHMNNYGAVESWTHPPVFDALEALGAQYVNIHLYPRTQFGDWNATRTLEMIGRIDAGMRAHGLKYTLSTEDSNLTIRAEVTPGVNEYTTAEGFHRFDVRREWLAPLLEANRTLGTAFLGVTYDEPAHTQLESNKYAKGPEMPYEIPFQAPYLADTTGMGLEEAWTALCENSRTLREGHYQGQTPLAAEQVIPDMAAIFARAGWSVTPKLLKENFSSVIMAESLGAALQYKDRTSLNAVADLWSLWGFPGHTTDALRSALLMGYWLGVDTLYVENLDFPDAASAHPDYETGGGLIRWLDADTWEMLPHGQVVVDFFKEYVPANPRTVDWRNYRPRVAIVRLPDGAFGQRGHPYYFDRLMGNPEKSCDEISDEWLQVWPLLTHGVVRPGSISAMSWHIYPVEPLDFFVPIDSVVVFDHVAQGPELDTVRCFVVCGHALSGGTFEVIRERVAGGATCIIARRLYRQWAGEESLPGDWLLVDDFTDPVIAEKIAPFLGEPDVARFRFENQVVEFRPEGNQDTVSVKVFDRTRIPELRQALLGRADPPADADLNGDGRFDVADLVYLNGKFE